MSALLQPNIILLREGTDTSQGRSQIMSNINACQVVVDIVKTTLGPRGMDKLIQNHRDVTISNDGATIVDLLDIEHPAAKVLADIAKSQDSEVGDGTTSVMLIAGELMKEAKQFLDDGMSPQTIIQGFREALAFCLEKLQELTISFADKSHEEKRDILKKCAQTSLNSKLLAHYKEYFSELVVQAVERLDPQLLDKELVGIKQVTGGSISESFLVDGVAFKKTFSYAGFEQQPKKFTNPKIVLLNLELELKSEKSNAEVRIEKPEDYQAIVDAEWDIIYEKLNNIKGIGADIVLSKLPIGDLATQYFADHNIFSAGRVQKEDMERLASATGAQIQTTVNGLGESILGTCGEFEEVQLGAERYNLFKNCPSSKTATIVLRGGAEQFIQEAERSLNDAIMIVRRAHKFNQIVAGGGAIELELSKKLREYARTIQNKKQIITNGFAKALEVIPRVLSDNAGLDSIEVLNKLRQKHALNEDGKYYGVDVNSQDGVINTYEAFIWEPQVVKLNALSSATEAACTILSIDETVKNPKHEQSKIAAKQAHDRARLGKGPGQAVRPPGLGKNMKLG
eukprot:TRINITY_DN295_c0_g1_i4.p1 TRINITY_DN295_c0_g1~~TRINITY_DN295_c0_g1_i4.p1  ORF type:complete len:568 (-),score=159.24 TRINITY_DN295_c0_g1_i4:157-1860(-)